MMDKHFVARSSCHSFTLPDNLDCLSDFVEANFLTGRAVKAKNNKVSNGLRFTQTLPGCSHNVKDKNSHRVHKGFLEH